MGSDALFDQVVPGPGHGPQGPGFTIEGLERLELVAPQAEILGDDLGVARVGLRPGDDLATPAKP